MTDVINTFRIVGNGRNGNSNEPVGACNEGCIFENYYRHVSYVSPRAVASYKSLIHAFPVPPQTKVPFVKGTNG